MIPFKNRFHGHSSLNYVYKNGQAVRSRLMTIKLVTNKHRQNSRVAIIISKKTLKSAVRRNRIRRRIYEVVRKTLPTIKNVYDIAVIVTASDVINLTPDELTQQIDQLLNQAGITSKTHEAVPKKS